MYVCSTSASFTTLAFNYYKKKIFFFLLFDARFDWNSIESFILFQNWTFEMKKKSRLMRIYFTISWDALETQHKIIIHAVILFLIFRIIFFFLLFVGRSHPIRWMLGSFALVKFNYALNKFIIHFCWRTLYERTQPLQFFFRIIFHFSFFFGRLSLLRSFGVNFSIEFIFFLWWLLWEDFTFYFLLFALTDYLFWWLWF